MYKAGTKLCCLTHFILETKSGEEVQIQPGDTVTVDVEPEEFTTLVMIRFKGHQFLLDGSDFTAVASVN